MGSKKSATTDVDTSTWLTCAESADLIHVSQVTIRSWVRRNLLHPRSGQRVHSNGGTYDVKLFDPSEIALRGKRRRLSSVPNDQGELAARAFEMFDQGCPLRGVVIELRETPTKVAELHDQWIDLGGSELVLGGAARSELERFVGPFSDVAGLVEIVKGLLGREVEIVLTEDAPDRAHAELARMTDAQVERRLIEVFLDGGSGATGATGESSNANKMDDQGKEGSDR